MGEKKSVKIILIVVLIIIVMTLALIFLIKAFTGKGNVENIITNTMKQETNQAANNQNSSQEITTNNSNGKVEEVKFIENLKAYFIGEKVTSVKLSRTGSDGYTSEVTYITNGLKAQKSDIEILNNHIKVSVLDDVKYEWDYKIDDDSATFIIKKDNPTALDKIILQGNVNNLSTIFVAYTELLEIEPKEALAFWELAIRDINKNKINDNTVVINNEIFSTTEECSNDDSYSFTLKIKNNSVSNLQRLLEIEKSKESTTKFIGY